MTSAILRLMKKSDIEFAYESIKIENWNYAREDIQRMFSYNPSGCFIAEFDGKKAGHVFSVNYGKLGWIGLLIVKAEFRRKDVATLLMKKTVDHLLNGGAETIKLEAAFAIADLYRKLGFLEEYGSLRFSGTNRKVDYVAGSDVKLLKKEKIEEIAKFDAEYFGANRIKVLSSLYVDHPKLCFVSYEGSEIAGYIMCRKTEKGYQVGPWICNPENPAAAKELLATCLETTEQNAKFFVGLPAINTMSLEILREFDLEEYSKSIRMRLGTELENEHVSGIFGIGGPEKG